MKRVAIVTGAAKPDSIGAGVAKGLLDEGCDVVVADLYEEGFSPDYFCVKTDVADIESVESMVRKTVERFSRIDILVNAVGGSWGITQKDLTAAPPRGFRGLANCTLEDWRTILGANLDSAYYCSRAAAPHLKKQGGAIVNISSVAARHGGLAMESHYAASKGAIDSFTVGLAKEIGTEGVRVNAVRPGFIMTAIHEAHGGEATARAVGPTVPIGRVGQPAEVAETVLWLASDAASYLHGAVIDVSGGR